jgi:hypothetical protein
MLIKGVEITLLEINIDEKEIRKIYLQKIEECLKSFNNETLFWDTEDLMKNTRLSWNTIQKEFFYDERFPKKKLNRKWLFPAEKTKKFLLDWLEKQNG